MKQSINTLNMKILQVLKVANSNIQACTKGLGLMETKKQLDVVVELLDKGYSLDDNYFEIVERYGKISNVPDKKGSL